MTILNIPFSGYSIGVNLIEKEMISEFQDKLLAIGIQSDDWTEYSFEENKVLITIEELDSEKSRQLGELIAKYCKKLTVKF